MGSEDPLERDGLDGVVVKLDLKLDILAQQPAPGDIPGEAVQARERVAGQHAAKMADYIPFVVVFGRLYKDNANLSMFRRDSQ
jgi:hypothetical protein